MENFLPFRVISKIEIMRYCQTILVLLAAVSLAAAQPATDAAIPAPSNGEPVTNVIPVDKRIGGVLPNYRSAELRNPFARISPAQKFKIATEDSFDYPVFGTTAVFAGISQLEGENNRVYGQGVKGFAYRYGINYVDQVIGNYYPEAIVPTLFHTDPRYFRKGTGSFSSRLYYAVSRIVVCRSDKGNTVFNVNEWVGNSLAATTAAIYHPHERTVGDIASEAEGFIVSDTIGQVLREFWPDIKRKLQKRHEAH